MHKIKSGGWCHCFIYSLLPECHREIDITDAFDDEPKSTTSPALAAADISVPEAAAATPSTSTTATPSPAPTSASSRITRQQRGPKTRKQRQADMAQAADAASSSKSAESSQPRFKRCKDAIDAGLEAFQGKDYKGAIDLFNMALELPGNGEECRSPAILEAGVSSL